jgi:hypothetical protein
MNNRRRTAAALGVGGVIVAVILWQWLTAPVEWGPVDAVIRQTGLKLVSCPWVPLKRIRPDTSCDLPPVGESFVCRWSHGGRGAVRPAVAGGVRRWAVGPPAAPGRLAGRILQTVFERRETLGGDTTTRGDSAGAGAAWRWWGSRYFPAAHGKTADRTETRGDPPGGFPTGGKFPIVGKVPFWQTGGGWKVRGV